MVFKMKKIVAVLVLGLLSADCFGMNAYFTGRMIAGTSAMGRFVYSCEYQFNGRYFWREFENYCPTSVGIN
jgi:hypothetical protein